MLNPIADRLDRYMSLLAARQQITASNIANADTPGYKTRDVDFRAEMSAAASRIEAREVDGLPVKNDGNNVSIDREARTLAETALKFNVASQLLQSQIRITRIALQEGK
jgi:flagellar basal-body rod protein FlgB